MALRAIFFGTPEFAVPSLQALATVAEVPLVVCQPDRPAGRGMKLTAPPVKHAALAAGLNVAQPVKLRTRAFAERLQRLKADVALVIAYGRILPPQVLAAPRLGCVNLHASLLPKYRGAAPIQWAILRGERETGVCLMKMDEGMDTGPELARVVVPIGVTDTAGSLNDRLSLAAAELLKTALPAYVRGELPEVVQDNAAATVAPMLKKSDGLVDFSHSADAVHDHIRGMDPWPGAFTYWGGKRIRLLKAQPLIRQGQHGSAGLVVYADNNGIDVACGTGVISIKELQLEGRKRVTAAQFCVGQPLQPGTRFAAEPS